MPKYITKSSLSIAISHLRISYLNQGRDTNETEFIECELCRILPNLEENISKHFALTVGINENLLSDVYIGNEEEDSHVEQDDSLTNKPQTIECPIEIDVHESPLCIWCGSPTESDYDKPLCERCVAIPERLDAIECQLSLIDIKKSVQVNPTPESRSSEKFECENIIKRNMDNEKSSSNVSECQPKAKEKETNTVPSYPGTRGE